MPDKHLSSQFDVALNSLSDQLMQMGGLVESQIVTALRAFSEMDVDLCEQVIEREKQINSMEVSIDSACVELIALRQPIASDLRLVMAISKAITNLERVGDEAEKIAKRTKRIIQENSNYKINTAEIKVSGQMAVELLRKSLDCFARLDAVSAVKVVEDDLQIDEEFRGFVRKMITYMMEDPKVISVSLDLLFIAKAIERIGDHAKNIAEFVIYVAKGSDVRHVPRDQLIREANS
jgi:phosphate transport system protein